MWNHHLYLHVSFVFSSMYNNCATEEPNRQFVKMKSWIIHPEYRTNGIITSLLIEHFICILFNYLSKLLTWDWYCWTAPLTTNMGGQRQSPLSSSTRPTHNSSTENCMNRISLLWEWEGRHMEEETTLQSVKTATAKYIHSGEGREDVCVRVNYFNPCLSKLCFKIL